MAFGIIELFFFFSWISRRILFGGVQEFIYTYINILYIYIYVYVYTMMNSSYLRFTVILHDPYLIVMTFQTIKRNIRQNFVHVLLL